MNTFQFPFHRVTDEYPQNSVTLRFGSGYSFASKPKGPPQLVFHLKFDAMWWYTDRNGAVDRTYAPPALPGTNLAALVDFYESVQLWDYFLYPHPVRGDMTVRFAKPFVTPENLPGTFSTTNGGLYLANQVAAFTLDFIQQPS